MVWNLETTCTYYFQYDQGTFTLTITHKFMRQKFFEKVGNDQLDFDKFYEFYKWFDTSLSVMLAQLVPASADFSDNVLTVIENHILDQSFISSYWGLMYMPNFKV